MKKSLRVRAGAVAMVLMLVFFMVLPEMIRAEGEEQQEVTTETAVSQAAEETPAEEVQEEKTSNEEAPAAEETPADAQAEETPADAAAEEVPSDAAAEETPEAAEIPAATETAEAEETTAVEETPVAEEVPVASVDTNNGITEKPTEEAPIDVITEGETETEQMLMDNAGDKKGNARAEEDKEVIEVYNDVTDFIMEGTVLTGYQGAGGIVAIPEGVTAIADNTFYGNANITGVSFPGSLSVIGSSAFNGCVNLAAVTIPANVTSIGVSAFANCTGLAAVNLSGSAQAIAQGTFFNCISLTNVVIPEGVTSIASEAFGSCSNLSSISLPSTLASLDLNAFSNSVNLADISVAAGNGTYSSYDGCLYTAGGGQLILCPPGKTTITFTPEIISVASGAFSGCNYISTVNIPASVGTIDSAAFSGSSVHSITIPATVTNIGTQSGWTPAIVYGYSGSVAESWAEENKYVFESLDGESNNDDDNQNNNGGEGDGENDGDEGNSGGGNADGGNSGGTQPNSGTHTTTVSAASPGTSSGTSASIDGHVKDATPKTGVEDYGIYCLFGAILLIGAACFAYSKKLRCE